MTRFTFLGAVLLALCSCGPAAPTIARKTITAADEIQIAGMKSFVDFDLIHQTAILEAQGTPDEKRAELAGYRNTRGKLVSAFSALAAASHGAKATVDAYEAGTIHSVAWGELVQAVLSTAEALRGVAEMLGVKIPGLDALLGARSP